MWIVEVNILGRRFTRQVNERPEVPRSMPRMAYWRQWKQRRARAAA